MKKIFEKIHLWLSVPFGLIITLICFSGAMLVFEDEVNELFRHELYYVETVGEVPLPIEQLLEKVTATLPDSVSVTSVSISSDSERAYQVNLSKPRRASLYVDQYTGEVKGKSERSGFFMFMFRMHRWLLDSMNPGNEGIFWGKMIVLPLHTLAVSFLAGDLNITLLAVCVVKILFSTTMAGLIWCIGYIAYNHFKGTQDPDWETMEKEYMAEKEEKERQAS